MIKAPAKVTESTPTKTRRGIGLVKPLKLSDDLAELVGKKEASRQECL